MHGDAGDALPHPAGPVDQRAVFSTVGDLVKGERSVGRGRGEVSAVAAKPQQSARENSGRARP